MLERVCSLVLLVIPVTLALCGVGCTMAARLYDLDSATVLQAKFKSSGSGRGPIFLETPGGQTCNRQYVTVGDVPIAVEN